MRREVLCMHDVTLVERESVQLEDFSLNVFESEIVGILPLNGHGVNSLVDLLQNNLSLQAGYVYYREELVNCWRTPRMHANKIAVIKNVSTLVESMTVADNIFVLRPGFRVWMIRQRMLVQQLQPVLDALGVHIAADAYIDTLSHFEKVVVELVKAVIAGYRLIVLQEISNVISDQELARLHKILRHYANEGISFLYIGFHYEELVQICDRTAIYSNGRILKYFSPEEGEPPYKEQYVQRVREQIISKRQGTDEKPVLEIRDLHGGNVKGLSFAAAAGECVVVQDPQNMIFEDLIDLLIGEKPIEAGEILVEGRKLENAREIAIIREQPEVSMIFEELSYLDNLCITADHRLRGIWSSRRLRAGLRREWASRVGKEVFELPVGLLSSRQRLNLVCQRVILQRPKVVFSVQPFKGADVSMRMYIWDLLKGLMDEGIAIVILAVNLADAFTLATRLVRVEQEHIQTYEQDEFDHLPFGAPWLQLYKHVPPSEKRK